MRFVPFANSVNLVPELKAANTTEMMRLYLRKVPVVLKKSILADERKFLGPLMSFARGDVRDDIHSHRNDHESSYQPQRALQQ